ncbi:MAG: UV DNA damage repair endonuclease UvsE [Cellulosilyticaceae bacterium]
MCQIKTRLGYACINMSLKNRFRTFRLKTVEERDISKIKEVIYHNIKLLGDIIHYNINNNIYVYRISSDIIPFGSHPAMIKILEEEGIMDVPQVAANLKFIADKRVEYNMRLSMHPSQFTLLTSPKEEITERAILDINYQTQFLKKIGGSNLILHIGGAYGDKDQALARFEDHVMKYKNMIDTTILTIENDDKTYTSKEVITTCKKLGLKWVYDFHHERCNPSENNEIFQMLKVYPPDKYHLSSGVNGVIKPPHAEFITREDYEALIHQLQQAGIAEADIMLEAKQKNLAIFEIFEPCTNGYWQLKE